jgi:hypothetical protein
MVTDISQPRSAKKRIAYCMKEDIAVRMGDRSFW